MNCRFLVSQHHGWFARDPKRSIISDLASLIRWYLWKGIFSGHLVPGLPGFRRLGSLVAWRIPGLNQKRSVLGKLNRHRFPNQWLYHRESLTPFRMVASQTALYDSANKMPGKCANHKPLSTLAPRCPRYFSGVYPPRPGTRAGEPPQTTPGVPMRAIWDISRARSLCSCISCQHFPVI